MAGGVPLAFFSTRHPSGPRWSPVCCEYSSHGLRTYIKHGQTNMILTFFCKVYANVRFDSYVHRSQIVFAYLHSVVHARRFFFSCSVVQKFASLVLWAFFFFRFLFLFHQPHAGPSCRTQRVSTSSPNGNHTLKTHRLKICDVSCPHVEKTLVF